MSEVAPSYPSTSRQRFEAWLAGVGYASSRCSDSDPEAEYCCAETQAAWLAWLARAGMELNGAGCATEGRQ